MLTTRTGNFAIGFREAYWQDDVDALISWAKTH